MTRKSLLAPARGAALSVVLLGSACTQRLGASTDAAVAGRDATPSSTNLVAPDADDATLARDDAAIERPRDVTDAVDAAVVTNAMDAGAVARDAGSVARDAGSVARDAGAVALDVGAVARDAGTALRDAGCARPSTRVDANGFPRDAMGHVRQCWPDESRCNCDADGDCYALAGYVPCGAVGDASAGARRYVPPPDPTGGGACPTGQMRCPYTAFLDEPPSFARCQPAPSGRCPAPDLVIRRAWITDDTDEPTPSRMYLDTQTFLSNTAEVTEGCVRGPGRRRLLRFNFAAINVGDGPFRVGRPDENDTVHWQNFTAHGHFHIRGWGDYTLRTIDGGVVVSGRKQSFCLEDNIREGEVSPASRQFAPPRCANFSFDWTFDERPEFGLSPMWGDEYPSSVPCQWLDLGLDAATATDHVPDGIYRLALAVNIGDRTAQPLYRESNYSNNRVEIRVEIRGAAVSACADNAGDACPGATARRACDGRCP